MARENHHSIYGQKRTEVSAYIIAVQDACTRAMRDGARTEDGMLVCTLPDELMRDLKRGANGLQAQYNTTDAVLILYMEAQRYERAQGARWTR